jgi:shikimate kinase
MTKFLLIGPSGVGKSTALKALSADKSVDIFDLDELVKRNVGAASLSKYFSEVGNQNFFNKSVDAIESLQIKKTSLIAVGAGSIDYIDGHKWYQNQNTIVLTGNPDIIYNRSDRQRFHPTLDGYKALEFSQPRQSLYSNSKYSIDVTNLNSDQVADKIRDIIKNCS